MLISWKNFHIRRIKPVGLRHRLFGKRRKLTVENSVQFKFTWKKITGRRTAFDRRSVLRSLSLARFGNLGQPQINKNKQLTVTLGVVMPVSLSHREKVVVWRRGDLFFFLFWIGYVRITDDLDAQGIRRNSEKYILWGTY